MTQWKLTGTRVHGDGKSYNCINIVTAKELQCILNGYGTKITEQQAEIQTHTNLTKMRQQLIALQMDLTQIQNDLIKI
jgi:hypothetical protein